MIGVIKNKAEIEYAVMLAVLNFQTEFMKSRYNQAHVHVSDRIIEVLLTRSATIPAEERLGESAEGRALLHQVHAELFKAGASLLRNDLERALAVKIQDICSRLDTVAGTNVITITLTEALQRRPN